MIFSSPSDASDASDGEDQDGFLTRDEFGTASKGYLDLLDKDGDGKLSLSRNTNRALRSLMDTDRDGMINKRELRFSARPAFVFDRLDADGDGKITRVEYNAGFNMLDTDNQGLPISAIPFTATRGRDARFHLLQNATVKILLTAKRDALRVFLLHVLLYLQHANRVCRPNGQGLQIMMTISPRMSSTAHPDGDGVISRGVESTFRTVTKKLFDKVTEKG